MMERKQLEAATTVVDQELGQFEALVSAWDTDREKDMIAPTAFTRTIAAWQGSGKNLPLLFEHSTEEIGHIDPFTMRATEAGLVAAGEVDRSTEHGRQVWKQIKRGTAGFSIGFIAESKPRKGGGRYLTEIDLLEISATSTPMHPSARALSWKSSADHDANRIRDEARRSMLELLTVPLDEPATTKSVERPIQIASFDA